MADELKKVISIEIDQTVIKKAEKSATELAGRIKQLKEEQKAAKGTSAELTAEYVKRDAELKALNKEQRKNINVLTQANKVTKAAEGSNEKLRAQLSILTSQYNALSKEERTNTEQGQRLGKQVRQLSDELKSNEKAVGDNRRNVGNYESALKDVTGQINIFGVNVGNVVAQLKTYKDGLVATRAATKASTVASGGLSGALQILKVALISTGIGAIVVALGSMVTFLTQTKRGSELLAQGMSALGATMSVIIDRISLLGEGFVNVFTNPKQALKDLGELIKSQIVNRFTAIPALLQAAGKGFKALADKDFKGMKEAASDAAQAVIQLNTGLDPKQQKKIADGIKGVGKEIVEESKAATDLEKRMQKLRDRERELIVSTAQRNAEVAKLRVTIEDQSKSEEERLKAAQRATALQRQTIEEEKALAQERVDIIQAQLALSENLEEDEQRLADAKAQRFQVEERATTRLVELNNKEVQLRKQIAKEREGSASKNKELAETEVETEEERQQKIEQGYAEERRLLDQQAELKKAQATIEIANAEERAERIAFIEKETLLAKLRSIEDETVAYTASADMIGAVDEEKYAKQLAERAKYEAELAEMDRAAKAEEFTREIELLNGREEIESQSAELEIENAEELEKKKYEIALKYAQLRLAAMKAFAEEDGIISEQEQQELTKLELKIKQLLGLIQEGGEDGGTSIASMIGLSPEDIGKINEALGAVTNALNAVQGVVDANAEMRLQEIDQRTEAEIASIEKSKLSEEQKEQKITEVEKKAAKERYKIELQQFKTAKALQIALAVANTATAVMAQLSNPTPYVGFVLAGLAAATGAVQIATIANQQPPPPPAFATGGKVVGAGTGTSDSIAARLSNGEAVINAKSTAMYEPVLSAINAAGGGVDWYNGEQKFNKGGIVQKFAAGGVAMSSSAIMRENEATREIQQTILQSPPVLVLEEFQDVQGRQVRTENNLQV